MEDLKKTKLLCKYLGGSHFYGLNTADSDVDEREIFMNTDAATILGTRRFDQEVRNNKEEDVHKTEIRRLLELARKGNTQSVEVLFADENSFEVLSDEIVELRRNKNKLINPDTLFKVISSFVHAQYFLIFDDKRKAEEGSKRDLMLKKYGYVPKAASTSARLCLSGISFFMSGEYKVEMKRDSVAGLLKFKPEDVTGDEVRGVVEGLDRALKAAYENSRHRGSYRFDEDYANEYLRSLYLPYLLKPTE